jgi:hypothetical protein
MRTYLATVHSNPFHMRQQSRQGRRLTLRSMMQTAVARPNDELPKSTHSSPWRSEEADAHQWRLRQGPVCSARTNGNGLHEGVLFRRILKKGFKSRVLIVRDLLKTEVVICANARWRTGDGHEKRPDRCCCDGDTYGPSNSITQLPQSPLQTSRSRLTLCR